MKKLVFALLIAFASTGVFASDDLTVPSQTEIKTGVRKPVGDVNKFWDNIKWDQMSVEEQKLWGVLGWNAINWISSDKSKTPASDNTAWDKLSKREQAAATALSYDKQSWNAN